MNKNTKHQTCEKTKNSSKNINLEIIIILPKLTNYCAASCTSSGTYIGYKNNIYIFINSVPNKYTFVLNVGKTQPPPIKEKQNKKNLALTPTKQLV